MPDNSVKLYGKLSGCPFCDKSKKALEDAGIDFEFIDIERDKELFNFFKLQHQYIPQFYVNGCLRSGGSEAVKVYIDSQMVIEDLGEDWDD